MYNVWREHPEWDLSFLGEVAMEMVAEWTFPFVTPIEEPSGDLALPAEPAPPVN